MLYLRSLRLSHPLAAIRALEFFVTPSWCPTEEALRTHLNGHIAETCLGSWKVESGPVMSGKKYLLKAEPGAAEPAMLGVTPESLGPSGIWPALVGSSSRILTILPAISQSWQELGPG